MKDETTGAAARIKALQTSGLLSGGGRKQFGNQVALVRQALDVPVALVTLVDGTRQVFAAQAGLPEPWASKGETPLTHSFCQHVVRNGEALVVRDSHEDSRVVGNLAIKDLNVRAYLGVPIALPDGMVVGALAAIDAQPRQWTDGEKSLLEAIARVVSDELETRISETEWQGVFERMQEGLIVGEVIRDEGGRVIDWRYKRVNRAWGDLVGIPAETATGRTIREVFPGIEDEWVNEFAQVVDTRETIRFTRQVGSLGRWYDGVTQPDGPERFVTLFTEVTERVRAEAALRQREAEARRTLELQTILLELGEALRLTDDIEQAGYAAAEALARGLDPTRTGYGVVDAVTSTVEILTDWRKPGVPSISGNYRFRDFGHFIDDLKAGEVVMIPDVREDARTRAAADHFGKLGIVALVNVPIMEHGNLVGVVIVHVDEPRAISDPNLAFVKNVADRAQAAVARLQAETQQRVLNDELSHRMKNSLGLVQAIAAQTLRGRSEKPALAAFEKRIGALSRAHDVLLRRSWTAARIVEVVRDVLASHAELDRIDIDGPDIILGARATLSLSLLLHELATNAAKYGALSKPEGRVSLAWRVESEGVDAPFVLGWREHSGPPIIEPSGRGFGTRLIAMGLLGTGGTEITYKPDGLHAEFRGMLADLQRQSG